MDREDIRDFVEGLIGFGSIIVIAFVLMGIGG